MKHYINGVQVNPVNQGEIGIRVQYTDRGQDLMVSTDNIVLTREDYDVIKTHIQSVGFFEGLPYQLISNSGVTLDYFIDLLEKPIFRDYEVELKLKKRGGLDKFWQDADGTSFELLAKKGFTFQPFNVPYVIIKDNQIEVAITVAITLFLMVKELADATRQLVYDVVDLIGSVTPNVGFGVNWDIGDIIAKVVKVVIQLAYVALLLAAVIKLSQQLFELIFPKIRNFLGAKVKELLRVGCQYLGYQFSSTALDSLSGLTIVGKPLKKQAKRWFMFTQNDLNLAFNKGYPTASDTTSTLGGLMEAMRKMINGRVTIIGNTVHLERRDFFANTSNQILPALKLQDTRQDEYTVNTQDVWKRYYTHYLTDISDLHTYDNFEGVDCEHSCEPLSVVNSDLVSIKGFVDVNIPFALGARKDSLNWLERAVKDLFRVIDKVISTFGGNSALEAKIQNRIGVLMLSQQYFNTSKLLYTVSGKQPANYLSKISALSIYNQFHSINEIQVNGKKEREGVKVAINDNDFLNLLGNNFAIVDNEAIELTELTYIEDEATITISYLEPYNYAVGKAQTLLING